MTKVGRLFEEEKIEAVKEATQRVTKTVTEKVTKEVTKETTTQLAKNAYESLGDVNKVAELLKLPVDEVEAMVDSE